MGEHSFFNNLRTILIWKYESFYLAFYAFTCNTSSVLGTIPVENTSTVWLTKTKQDYLTIFDYVKDSFSLVTQINLDNFHH